MWTRRAATPCFRAPGAHQAPESNVFEQHLQLLRERIDRALALALKRKSDTGCGMVLAHNGREHALGRSRDGADAVVTQADDPGPPMVVFQPWFPCGQGELPRTKTCGLRSLNGN